MKKASIIIATIILAFFVNFRTMHAQVKNTGEQFFIGKWSLVVYGVPDGDTKMILSIDKKDDKLTGSLADPSKSDPPQELSGIEIADSTFKATFSAQGMDISLFLKIKDDNNITGNLMDMFDIKGSKDNTK